MIEKGIETYPSLMNPANEKNVLLARWAETLNRRADQPAVLKPSGETWRSFLEIEKEALMLAEALRDFPPRSVLAIQIGNSASWPALLLAAFRQELIPLPLGRHIEKLERELVMKTCGVVAIAEKESDGEVGFRSVNEVRAEWSGAPPDFLKLTSGTASTPRAVRFRSAQLVADCDNICETMGIGGDDINFGVIPFSHSYGFSNLITPLLCRGVKLVASEDRMPRAMLAEIGRSGATVFSGMPVFFEKLAEMENIPEIFRLRLCISAGAPLTKRVAEKFSEKFRLKIHTFYGASECGGIGYDESDILHYEDGFAGRPMKNVRIKCLDTDETSRIEVSSAAVGEGYFPESDLETLGEGRFVPGDFVKLSDRGLEIRGRATDVINVAGRKLNPAEIEAQIAKFSGVRQIVVFGIPSALRHEEAVACVAGDVSAREVLNFARGVLSAWQVPKDIWLVRNIPINERGKISRRELAIAYLKKEMPRGA